MTILVHLPSALYSYTAQQSTVEGKGATLAALLADLDARFPGIRFRVVDEQDRPREHIRFFVNGELARRIDLPVGPNDEVHVITALSGGA
ncbi:MAG: MoaD/ThiS family protein [Planctomycetota bacterium]